MYFESARDKSAYCKKGDNTCRAHFHKSTEILYVLSGEKRVFVNDLEYTLRPCDVLVCPPYAQHHYLLSGGGEQVVICIPPRLCENFADLCARRYPETYVFHDEKGEFTALVEELAVSKNEFLLIGAINLLFAKFCESVRFSQIKRDKERALVEKIFAYIEEHYQEKITLHAIAHQFGYSPNYFSVLFKKNFRATLPEYLGSVRVQKSLPLLKTKSVAAVCSLCGFSSPQQYYLHFKKVYGCTPGEYKRG